MEKYKKNVIERETLLLDSVNGLISSKIEDYTACQSCLEQGKVCNYCADIIRRGESCGTKIKYYG